MIEIRGKMVAGSHGRVATWFAKKSVFITGSTGFMGKVLVEKLLRSCPDIHRLYLLMRPKKDKNVRERLESFFNCRVFDRLRDEIPDNLRKVVAISGDVLLDGLGISERDRQILTRECSVIFHCAANVRFDQKLKGAVLMNTLGTKKVLELAAEMQQLDVYVHVSTAYSYCSIEQLGERVYPAPHDPEKIIDLVSWMDNKLVDMITPQLIGELPNTYAYTKCLSEELVARYSTRFPCVIARPSIVVSALNEPMPGWIENLNGPTGLLVGAGKGVIRSMHCQEHYLADVVPVDIAINALIGLAWKVGTTKPETAYVCNLTESAENPISWGRALELGRKHLYENPFNVTIWYPDGSMKSSKLHHILCVIFLHLVPAYLIDFFLVLLLQKPFMVKIQKRVTGGLEVLQYYTTKQWIFLNDNLRNLREELASESDTFFMDINQVEWDSFLKIYVLGARQYCCKEDPATLPQARRKLRLLYCLDVALTWTFYAFLAWFIYRHIHVITGALDYVTDGTLGLMKTLPMARVVAEPL